jgi:hypothetical protein
VALVIEKKRAGPVGVGDSAVQGCHGCTHSIGRTRWPTLEGRLIADFPDGDPSRAKLPDASLDRLERNACGCRRRSDLATAKGYGLPVSIADKLHPDRFTAMSGKMAAIIAYVLGEAWTEPEITALSVTSDGFITTDSEFLGDASDLDRNILNVLLAAGLTDDERQEFERRYRERVDDWRPVLSGPRPADGRLTRPDFSSPGALA